MGLENKVSKGGHACVWERLGKETYREMNGRMSEGGIEIIGFGGRMSGGGSERSGYQR